MHTQDGIFSNLRLSSWIIICFQDHSHLCPYDQFSYDQQVDPPNWIDKESRRYVVILCWLWTFRFVTFFTVLLFLFFFLNLQLLCGVWIWESFFNLQHDWLILPQLAHVVEFIRFATKLVHNLLLLLLPTWKKTLKINMGLMGLMGFH